MANFTIVYTATKKDGLLEIGEATDDRVDAYKKFMATAKRAPMPFTYGDPTNPTTFYIVPMNDKKYDDGSFCVLLDDKGKEHFMTTNKPLLEEFVEKKNLVLQRWLNRGVKGGKRKTKKNRHMTKKKSRQRK
jgi:hypothetical protein